MQVRVRKMKDAGLNGFHVIVRAFGIAVSMSFCWTKWGQL